MDVEFRGITVLDVVDKRYTKESRIEGLFYYEVVHSPEDSNLPEKVVKEAEDNYMFTIITKSTVDIGKTGEIYLTEAEKEMVINMV